jgi:glycosyltransferase involved in cell wall biosynthesis
MRLWIVGSGEEEAACRMLAKTHSIRVDFAGFLNQDEIAIAYALADCLVLPSASETWGLVVNEALASGLPCVVSDAVGCAPDLITSETGAVFECGDIGALRNALESIRGRVTAGHDYAAGCRARAATCSFAAATEGLVAGCRALARASILDGK